MSLEPEQLGKVLGAVATPAPALTFETAADSHFDILFNDSAARAHRGKTATERAAIPSRLPRM